MIIFGQSSYMHLYLDVSELMLMYYWSNAFLSHVFLILLLEYLDEKSGCSRVNVVMDGHISIKRVIIPPSESLLFLLTSHLKYVDFQVGVRSLK